MVRNLVIAIILLIGSAGLGYYYGRGDDKQIEIHETKGETHVVYKDRIITKIKIVHPDGTVEERETTEEKEQKEDTSTTDTDTTTKSVATKYSLSLGITTITGLANPYNPENYYVGAGTRVLGPVWLEGSVRGDKSIMLGLRVEM